MKLYHLSHLKIQHTKIFFRICKISDSDFFSIGELSCSDKCFSCCSFLIKSISSWFSFFSSIFITFFWLAYLLSPTPKTSVLNTLNLQRWRPKHAHYRDFTGPNQQRIRDNFCGRNLLIYVGQNTVQFIQGIVFYDKPPLPFSCVLQQNFSTKLAC